MFVITQLTRPETLLVLLWVVQLVRMAWPGAAIDDVAAALAALCILRVFPLLRRPTVILCAALAILAAVLIFIYGGPATVLVGFRAAPMFVGFFGTIVLMRATADQLQQIASARALFRRLKPDHRLGGFLVGSHLLAVVLGPGAYAITAPIIGESKGEEEEYLGRHPRLPSRRQPRGPVVAVLDRHGAGPRSTCRGCPCGRPWCWVFPWPPAP